jgi:hypothetical protein
MNTSDYLAAMNARVATMDAREREKEDAEIAARRAAMEAARAYVADLIVLPASNN